MPIQPIDALARIIVHCYAAIEHQGYHPEYKKACMDILKVIESTPLPKWSNRRCFLCKSPLPMRKEKPRARKA
jgi:hypothetical protein